MGWWRFGRDRRKPVRPAPERRGLPAYTLYTPRPGSITPQRRPPSELTREIARLRFRAEVRDQGGPYRMPD